MKKRLLKMLIWWTVLYVWLALMTTVGPLMRYRNLARLGVVARGTIETKTDHQGIIYTFSVDGTTYSGISRTGLAGIPAYESIRPGEPVSVRYLPNDPKVNAAGEIDELVRKEYSDSVLLALFAVVGVVFVFAANALFPRKSLF